MQELSRLTLVRPDDWHLHLRDGAQMQAVLCDTARRFARAIVMPNLRPPMVTTEQALAYRERILAAIPAGMDFEPLMTLYLTDNTTTSEILKAKVSGRIAGIKYYPAGATTNSDSGVTDISRCYAVIAAMEQAEMPLLVHGEVTDTTVDIFDREKVFIDRVLVPLIKRFPRLRVIFEHITTAEAVQFVADATGNVAATITAHHLLLNRNAIFQGGVRPHYYCLPVLKRELHRKSLVGAATGGNPRFFLGTDSAPHARLQKEAACGCAGIYTAHAAIELYAEVFEQAGALHRLEGFASFHGPDFYRLPRNKTTLTLEKKNWFVPEELAYAGEKLIPFGAGEQVSWSLSA